MGIGNLPNSQITQSYMVNRQFKDMDNVISNNTNVQKGVSAYGWGNHSTAGYLTAETDPVFTASTAAGIDSTDIINWDDANSKKHTQNTDTGTSSDTFHINSDGTGFKFKDVSGVCYVRNTADTAVANLIAAKIGSGANPVSQGHIYQNSTDTGTGAGLTIEQAGDGDAQLQYLLTGVIRWLAGVDKSDSATFKIGRGANWGLGTDFSITTAGLVSVAKLNLTATTGTAPLIVASTTKVDNLNCDLFDDKNSDYYLNRSSSYVNTPNAFGSNYLEICDIYDFLHKGDCRFGVTQTGFTGFNAAALFDSNFDHLNTNYIATNGTGVLTIDLTAKGEVPTSGILYGNGHIYISFYSTRTPQTITARTKDKNGVWTSSTIDDVSNPEPVLPGKVYRINIPNNATYLTTIEITLTAQSSIITDIENIQYVLARPRGLPYSYIDKHLATNKLYGTLLFMDSNNANTLSLSKDGDIVAVNVQATHKSSDGTSGATGTINLSTVTSITVKDGLITGWT